MLIITLICSLLTSLVYGTPCWDESMSPKGKNSSCSASHAFLIFGYGKAIHRMDLDGRRQRRLVAGVGSSIILDFSFREETVFWADRASGVIYRARRGAHKQKVFSADRHISGLAVDWLWNNIYWTSAEKGKLRRIGTNGKNEETILKHLTQPSSITVDPTKRFLFWVSGEMSSSIQRSNLTGHTKTTIVKVNGQLNALAIDNKDKRLFWVQIGPNEQSAIGSCDYDGRVMHTTEHPLHSSSLGISIFMDTLYYNDFESRSIKRINKYGGQFDTVNRRLLAKPPVDMKVVHVRNQPMVESAVQISSCDELSGNCVNVCSRPNDEDICQCSPGFVLSKDETHCEDVNECAHWNHGCSLGCENALGSYFCTCPKGYTLLPDKKTCQEIVVCDGSRRCGSGCLLVGGSEVCVCPEGSVLTEDGQGCTGCSSADRGGCSQICSPLDSISTSGQWKCSCEPGYELQQDGTQCRAAGPASFLLVSTLVDVRKVSPDGAGEEILLSESTGRITALDFDPVQEEMYFTSTSRRTIERVSLEEGRRDTVISYRVESVQGLALDWIHRRIYWTDQSSSSVERSLLTGLNRETLISDGLHKPKAIAVHPLEKRLFWTDVGHQPAVESASLEGQGRVEVVSTNLVTPSGLTIDFTEERLFWSDSSTGRVESADLDGSQRRVLLEKQVAGGLGLAVFEERLWICERERHTLRSFHKRTGKELQQLHSNMVQPATVVVVHPVAKPGADVCLHKNGGCAQLCQSKLGSASCSCVPHYTLSPDGMNCSLLETAPNPTENNQFNEEATTVMSLIYTTTGRDDVDANTGTTSSLLDKMVADEQDCASLGCGERAQCVQTAEATACVCAEGFVGDGHSCLELETVPPLISNVTPEHSNDSNTVEKCPSSHESYCLYQGVCFYFPEMKSFACNCAPGYMGERCQFSDLEWWELQQAEEQKKRNVTIAACLVGLISLLSIAACVTYCFGTKRLLKEKSPDDSESETSVTVESLSESAPSSVLPFSLMAEGEVQPRSAICPSCSSDPGGNSEDSLDRMHEHCLRSAVCLETESLSRNSPGPASTFTTFKPQQQPPPHCPASRIETNKNNK